MDAVLSGGSDHRRRRKGSSSISGHAVVAQLLESPLPTPRRSCCGRAAADASPLRGGHVPFKWESSPGVPKGASGEGNERVAPPLLLPKPPPGRCGGAARRAYHHHHSNTTTDSTSSGDHGDGDTFSDALDRTSSSDRLAVLSARLSAIDGAFGSRSRRSPSFIMDRFLPAANAIATTSADKHPRRPSPPPRRSKSSSKHAMEEVAHIRRRALAGEQPDRLSSPPPRRGVEAAAQLPPCGDEEDMEGEQMTPRACGLIFFVPWSVKPVLLGFQRSPARSRTPRRADIAASAITASSSFPPRRSITLGDALEKECRLGPHWHDDEKSGSGKEEWSNPGWGAALLGTSKRYCADARKALLSRLTRSGTEGGDSPRIGRERRSGKPIASMLRSTSVRMPPLSPPSESWLSNARRSNAGNNKR
ncbi:hypothetical protein HU200_031870 [Digitaria exilis]|uniref:Uncharacterized protein n=1 Tax=Digitaria exilis TaxID=1010633 RepID=A0A835BUR3_9POAL|nr:hypothetical protein HU200_031870 [Digitaria exilis]CAB3464965.1 unnamed protein product [Digitaria exilis]